MYVYIYVCMCGVCVYAYMYACMYACMHVCMCMYMYVGLYVYMYVYVRLPIFYTGRGQRSYQSLKVSLSQSPPALWPCHQFSYQIDNASGLPSVHRRL